MNRNYIEKLLYGIPALIVFIFYFHTLGYPWKHFDEQIIYGETVLPVPVSFFEYIETISNLGLVNHFEASNAFYSSITNLRGTPLDTLFCLTIFLILGKNAFLYRIFSLFIHLINTFILGVILKKITALNNQKSISLVNASSVILLTCIWALHPVNVESVLFATNIGALITYLFCLVFLFIYISRIDIEKNNFKSFKKKDLILIFLVYLFPLFLNEYSVTFPLIIFSILFSFRLFHFKKSFKVSAKESIIDSSPLFIGLGLFFIHFFTDVTRINLVSSSTTNISLFFERIFWFTPHIFFHFLKLLFFPESLTIDQSGNIIFGAHLLDQFSIFCILLFFTFIITSFISICLLKNKIGFLAFTIIVPFFISVLPFLHFFSPAYCLCSERYLYLPSLLLVFGIVSTIKLSENKLKNSFTLVSLLVILALLGNRAYIRTLDWRDSVTLFTSAYKENKSPLLKALRLQFTGSILTDPLYSNDIQIQGLNYIDHSNLILNDYYNSLDIKISFPEILKTYGLDNKTQKVKTAYLIAFEKFGLERDIQKAYEILKGNLDKNFVYDPPIISFYSFLLKDLKKYDEAEKVLKLSLERNLSPASLVQLAEVYLLTGEYNKTEEYLLKSIKYFPYDIKTLLMLKEFYRYRKNGEKYKHYLKLYNIRTHSKNDE